MFHRFLVLKQDLGTYLSFSFLLISLYDLPVRQSPQFSRFSFFSFLFFFFFFFFFRWLWQGVVFWPRLCDLFVSHNPREVCASHSPGRILGFAYTTSSYGQIKIFCTTPSRLPFPPSRIIIFIIIIIFISFIASFSPQCKLAVFQRSLSNNKSPRVSRTFLSIRAYFNNVVIRMVSIFPSISNSSCIFPGL